MKKEGRKYIYLSNLNFGGTVFQTQVLDWLHLYQVHHLEFDLIQVFHVKDLKRPGFIKKQLAGIKKSTEIFAGSLYLFPSKSLLYIVNALVIFLKISRYVFKCQEILIFSRALIGKEIGFIRRITPAKVIFYFDARAASAEENKYIAIKRHNFSLEKYKIIANIHYLEYKTLCSADKVFVVSKVLQKYFQDTYYLADKKFVFYPCLSNDNRFYFSPDLRRVARNKLQITDQIKVFIYSGGIRSTWHLSERMFSFFNQLLKNEKNSLMLCLSKDKTGVEKIIAQFPELKPKFLSFSVPNEEVNNYLNAADFGILFRENTIMNNVASPTKFAEYMLCGLPVLISEGVGDYSNYTIEHNMGVLVKEIELNNPERFDLKNLLKMKFDRLHIADNGRKAFSKDSIINDIIKEFKA
jgi:hypothetical protein